MEEAREFGEAARLKIRPRPHRQTLRLAAIMGKMKHAGNRKARLKDILRVQAAENWLLAGRPDRALQELKRVTNCGWLHPKTESVIWRVAHAMEFLKLDFKFSV